MDAAQICQSTCGGALRKGGDRRNRCAEPLPGVRTCFVIIIIILLLLLTRFHFDSPHLRVARVWPCSGYRHKRNLIHVSIVYPVEKVQCPADNALSFAQGRELQAPR